MDLVERIKRLFGGDREPSAPAPPPGRGDKPIEEQGVPSGLDSTEGYEPAPGEREPS